MQFRQIFPKILAGICKKKSVQAPKKTKTCQLLSSKCCRRKVECSFNKPAVLLCQKSKLFWLIITEEKNYPKLFSQSIRLDSYKAVPTEMPSSNQLVFQKVFGQNSKKKTNQKLFDFLFLKKILWRDRIQFWQTCRCFHCREPKNFTLKIRKQKLNY